MKTVTKLISMLLLVAMCLSLVGGGAYAMLDLDSGVGSIGGDLGGGSIGGTGSVGGGLLDLDTAGTIPEGGSTGGLDLDPGSSTSGLDLDPDSKPSTEGTLDLDKGTMKGETDLFGSGAPTGTDGDRATVGDSTIEKSFADALLIAKNGGGEVKIVGPELNIDKPTTIPSGVVVNTNGFPINVNKNLTIESGATIKGGSINLNEAVSIKGTVNFNNIDVNVNFAGFTGGTIKMTEVNTGAKVFEKSPYTTFDLNSGLFAENPELHYNAKFAGKVVASLGGFTIDASSGVFRLKSDPSKGFADGQLQQALDAAQSGDTILVVPQAGAISLGPVTVMKNVTIDGQGEELNGFISVANGRLSLVNAYIVGGAEVTNKNATLSIGQSSDVDSIINSGNVELYSNGGIGYIEMEANSVLRVSGDNAGIDEIHATSYLATVDVAQNSKSTFGTINPAPSGLKGAVKGGIWSGVSEEDLRGYIDNDYYKIVPSTGGLIVQSKSPSPTPPTPGPTPPAPGPTGEYTHIIAYKQATTKAWNVGESISSVTLTDRGTTTYLTNGTDYSVSGTTLTISTYRLNQLQPQRSTVCVNGSRYGYIYVTPTTKYVSPSSYTYGSGTNVTIMLTPGDYSGLQIGDEYESTFLTLDAGDDYSYSGGNFYLRSAFLNELPNGRYKFRYLIAGAPGSVDGVLTITGNPGGGYDPFNPYDPYYPYYPDPTGYQLVPVNNKYTWESGSGSYGFRRSPIKYNQGGHIEIDGVTVPGDQYYDNGTDAFYIPADYIIKKLGSGAHLLTVYFDRNNSKSLTFYVGPILTYSTNKHVINSSQDLVFECTEPITSVRVGGMTLTNTGNDTNYILSNGGRRLTLKASFLNGRTAGTTYNLSVTTQSGTTAEAPFYILTPAQASASPRTGDESNIALWLAFMIISGGTLAVAIPRLKRSKF